MNPVIMHIWGPLSIHIYGTCIAIGIILGLWLLHNDKKVSSIISPNDASNLVTLMIVSGYLGGRILYMITDHNTTGDFAFLVQFWQPGLSIMGCIIAIAITTIAFLHSKKIPMLQLMDRLAVYSPLVQSFGRLGCFFTGCCYGIATNVWWSVTYSHPDNMAPLCTPLHPTQLYSSLLLFGVFIYLYRYGQYIFKKQGSVLIQYLILVSTE
ncbi:prolipoprotein diacylglyceryl transferase, partial [Candidatus Babeliales bacterium]|nr:prolipoprotein diacylglyceryl transferase [Candidatus Babeliales bacterium]